jgi:protein phosphatase
VRIGVPELSLVVLIGPSGSGKSTFARRHFKPTEVLSSDFFRGLVSDDENDQSATLPAFEVLHQVAKRRLAAGKLTVVDATNVQAEARKPLVALAREQHVLLAAIIFDLPAKVCAERNKARPDRAFGPHVVRQQSHDLRRSLRGLSREGFHRVHLLSSVEAVDAAVVERDRLWTDLRHEQGPFDIIGDVHGCVDELVSLLANLGYEVLVESDGVNALSARHPAGRKAVFLGDLVDRGPAVPSVLRLVMSMVASGAALCLPGNHDVKLLRKLTGKDVRVTHGLAASLEQLERETPEFRAQVVEFLDGLVGHFVLDGGRLVVAHAGMKEEFQGRSSARVREFALYGDTTGETDEFGLPVRNDWAAEYRGKAVVVYGHTPVVEAEWLNRTINIDTGCVFGGKLSALRYPEKEILSVPAARTYAEPARPLRPEETTPPLDLQQAADDVLDLADVLGKRIVTTRMHRTVTIREENAAAALEAMSRFAVNPKWLVYLPPTMSPAETSDLSGYLEHPQEAFEHYASQGIPVVVCEEKHMGSRAVIVIARDEEVARQRFGVTGDGIGACFTRTGRRFFSDADLQAALLARVAGALEKAGIWERLRTPWVCLDCEILPWSAKAQELLRQQYAAVGSASRAALAVAERSLAAALARGVDCEALRHRYVGRVEAARRYVEAYRRYSWTVHSLEDLKVAPFHVLASEGAVHADKDHRWHMDTIRDLCRTDEGLLRPTEFLVADLTAEESRVEGVRWWERLTEAGGEGMVVKPMGFVSRGRRGLVQPGVKCRGREYLRIIYGPEYDASENLGRLRSRSLAAKRSLALREFALGIEGLERFVQREPLRRVHECVFGVMALESEPVDPRL